jgi:WD40 repeat protein
MSNKLHRLEIAELIFLAGTIIGLVVAAIFGRAIFAIAPLFILVCLNLINRYRLKWQIRRNTSAAIGRVQRRLAAQFQEFASYYTNQPQVKGALSDGTPERVASAVRANVNPLDQDLAELQQQCVNLQNSLASVVNYLNSSSLASRVDHLEQVFTRLSRGLSGLSDQVDASLRRQMDDLRHQLKAVQRKTGTKEGGLRPKVEYLEKVLVQLSQDLAAIANQIEALQRQAEATSVPPVVRNQEQSGRLSYQLREERESRWEEDNEAISSPVPPPPLNLIPEPSPQTWRCVHAIAGHADWVSAVAIAPDAQTFVSSSFDQTIKVWNLRTGERIRLLCDRAGEIYAISLSQDGKTLASGGSDQTIKLWDLGAGQLIYTFWEYSGSIRSVALSPITPSTSKHGRILASGNFDHTIKLWHLETRELIDTLTGHSGAVSAIAFSPLSSTQGKILASAGADGLIKIWDWERRNLLQTFSGDLGSIGAIAFSPDGQLLASGSSDKTIKLWHLTTGERMAIFRGHAGAVTSVIISPDGETLISGSADSTIQIWHLATGKSLGVLSGEPAESVISLAISSDGQMLVSGGAYGTLKIWQRD